MVVNKDRAGRLLDADGQRYFKGDRYGSRGEAKEHVKRRSDRAEKYDRGRAEGWGEARKERDR